jgi:hypothetical protein
MPSAPNVVMKRRDSSAGVPSPHALKAVDEDEDEDEEESVESEEVEVYGKGKEV